MNLIFDWAGTLADDQELTWRITDQTIQSFGKASVDFETYKREFSLPAQNFYRKFCPGISWEEIETAFAAHCRRQYPAAVKLWPDLREGLSCLACKHKLFLLSTLDQAMLEEALDLLEIRKYFQAVAASVPDKTAVLPGLLKTWGLIQDETVMVGDTPHDILAAKAASIQPIAVNYGYAGADALAKAEPEIQIGSVRELLRYLDKLACAESRHFPVATVGGLISDEEGNILLVRTRKWSNLFGIPGGKIDYGETMQAAFVREAKEETGLAIRDVMFVMNQDSIEHPQFYRPRHFILVNFTAKTAGVRPRVKLNHESEDFVWTSLAEALRLPLNEPTRILIEKILESETA